MGGREGGRDTKGQWAPGVKACPQPPFVTSRASHTFGRDESPFLQSLYNFSLPPSCILPNIPLNTLYQPKSTPHPPRNALPDGQDPGERLHPPSLPTKNENLLVTKESEGGWSEPNLCAGSQRPRKETDKEGRRRRGGRGGRRRG